VTPRLHRSENQKPAPVRIIHVGLGNFVRAHLAWYTQHAPDAEEWGIAAFTGRRPQAAQDLAPQDGLYTLITRDIHGDQFETISTLSAVHPASDHEQFLTYLRDPHVAIISLTVTEAGYRRTANGHLDVADADVRADISTLRTNPAAPVITTPAKLVAGLLARYRNDAGPIAVLPCDNLPQNGQATQKVVQDLAAAIEVDKLAPAFSSWLAQNVAFATTMVDRITPNISDADRQAVTEAREVIDAAPVVTEPFSEWVLSGQFPAGRPNWEAAGVQVVSDVGPYEQRKLLLLNGAHSLMAYAATALGHETVFDAISDGQVRGWVEALWDDATSCLDLPLTEILDYRKALLGRFENPRMRDVLARIAADGSQKIPVRIVPVTLKARSEGAMPTGAVAALAGWIAHLRGHGAAINDPAGAQWQELASGSEQEAVQAVLSELIPKLAEDTQLRDAVQNQLLDLTDA